METTHLILPDLQEMFSGLSNDMWKTISGQLKPALQALRKDVPSSGDSFADMLTNPDMWAANMVTAVNNINVKEIREGDFIYTDDGNKRILSAFNIGYCAFANCRKLKTVVLPRINLIFPYAFFGCKSLETIDLSRVSEIGEFAFLDCENLTSIHIDADSCLDGVGKNAFSGCKSLKGDLRFPDGLVEIGEDAFSYTGFSRIIFGEKTQFYSFGDCAFRGCKNLVEVRFPTRMSWRDEPSPYGIKEQLIIGFVVSKTAFASCSNLETITLPDCTKEICSNAFFDCGKLTKIIFGGTAAQWHAIKKGDYWDGDTGDYTVYCSDGTQISKA